MDLRERGVRLHEFEAKACLRARGAVVPRGFTAATPDEVADRIQRVGLPAVIKAQVAAGGREKAGLIRHVGSSDDALRQSAELFGRAHEGEIVRSVLVEERVAISRELFVALTVDDVAGGPMLVLSGFGGVDVEQLIMDDHRDVVRIPIDLAKGLRPHEVIPSATGLGIRGKGLVSFLGCLRACWATYVATDASVVEVNPLALTADDDCVIVDAKIVVDDSALWRQDDFRDRPPNGASGSLGLTDLEIKAESKGIRLTELGGTIAVLSGGAGMTMAIVDAIADLGGSAANFLDMMGGASADEAAALAGVTLEKVAEDPSIQAVLMNLSLVASPIGPFVEGFERAFREHPPRVPVVGCVRAGGAAVLTMPIAEASRRIAALGVELHPDMETAIKRAIAIAEAGVS